MIVDRAQLEDSLTRLRREVRDPRAGIHGPGSVAWKLTRDSAVFLGGGRAVLLQLAHPFVAYAIAQHSRTRDEVLGRFKRTFDNVFAMSFGDLESAFTAARRVHNIHTRIVGTIGEDAGRFPRGTPYQANDVDSLLWVWATLVDTVIVVQERLGGALPADVLEAHLREAHAFARLFGIPDTSLPQSWREFRAYVAGMVASDALTVTAPAREMAGFLFGGALGGMAAALTAGFLPERLRRDYALPYGVSQRVQAGAMIALSRSVRAVGPRALAELPAYRDAKRRLQGLPPSKWSRWLDARLADLAGRTARG